MPRIGAVVPANLGRRVPAPFDLAASLPQFPWPTKRYTCRTRTMARGQYPASTGNRSFGGEQGRLAGCAGGQSWPFGRLRLTGKSEPMPRNCASNPEAEKNSEERVVRMECCTLSRWNRSRPEESPQDGGRCPATAPDVVERRIFDWRRIASVRSEMRVWRLKRRKSVKKIMAQEKDDGAGRRSWRGKSRKKKKKNRWKSGEVGASSAKRL